MYSENIYDGSLPSVLGGAPQKPWWWLDLENGRLSEGESFFWKVAWKWLLTISFLSGRGMISGRYAQVVDVKMKIWSTFFSYNHGQSGVANCQTTWVDPQVR